MKDEFTKLVALLFLGLMLGTVLDGAKAQVSFMNEKHEWQTLLPGDIGQVLRSDEAGNWRWVTPEKPPVVTGNIATITNITEYCEEGWTLVADQSMHPMCARELKEPKR
jgi:hypothetical protein